MKIFSRGSEEPRRGEGRGVLDERPIEIDADQRRAHTRRESEAEVEVLTPRYSTGVAVDVSQGGVRIAVNHALAIGQSITLIMREHGRRSSRRARVVWSSMGQPGAVHGLQFVD